MTGALWPARRACWPLASPRLVTFVVVSCIATREAPADHDHHPSCPRAKVTSGAAQAGCRMVSRAAEPTTQPSGWPCITDSITLSRCAMSAPHRAHADRMRSLEQNEVAELGQWLRYEPEGRCDRSGDRQQLEMVVCISFSRQCA